MRLLQPHRRRPHRSPARRAVEAAERRHLLQPVARPKPHFCKQNHPCTLQRHHFRGGVRRFECAPLSGCGSQHPFRALGGTRVLLAAAPTTPPCFRHWRRSSSLQRKEYFICSSETPAGVSELLFCIVKSKPGSSAELPGLQIPNDFSARYFAMVGGREPLVSIAGPIT